ncbi:MAG: CHRD domain-containing protein [Bacteroidota bacterium]|nr:CHRD domain-containing protein [Bacteroidota bacterium]
MYRKLLPLLLILSTICSPAWADHLSSSLLFTARMNGGNEVPAVSTDAEGLGIISFDQKKSTLYVNVSLSSLSGAITGIHIHEGAVGENGPVIFNLTPFLNGNRVKGTIQNITRDQFAKFVSGAYYMNAHTAENPGGEIRGQVLLETDSRFAAQLSGDNEVPAVAADGVGLFVANLSKSEKEVKFKMVFQGLTSAVTGAHIHNAPAGANGGVIFDLTSFISGNIINGTWDPTGFVDALKAGELYVNVHTVNNPGGEIRGQLILADGLTFDALINGNQENPSTTTNGSGVGIFTVSPDLSTIEYYVVFDSLSGPVTGSHFHAANAGSNGGVIIDLTNDVNGNVISGSAPITIDQLNTMLAGGVYINIHTAGNPGGEIRGQVYKLAREPYMFELNGGQENPPVTTSGTGAGIVTIDRDQSNAHYMIVYSNLQGEFTASHFHNGKPGENGGVIFDLTAEYNDVGGVYGYWDQSDSPAFNASLLFRENEVYLNVHSTLFPGGEIRGNIVRLRDLFTAIPFDPGFENSLTLAAELNGDNEVPATTSTALGLATIYLDDDRTTATINVTVSGLSGPITGAHIHDGISGVNGPVVFPLITEGNRIQMEISDITTDQLGKLLGGAYYINVHTAANPGGEIRGQIFLEQDISFVAPMTGDNEVPGVTTDGRGLGVFHYTNGTLTLDVNVQLTELSSTITGAHFHNGAEGENGPVVIDLGSLINGNTIRGTVDLTFNDLILLATNNLYINVHTADNPGGEIRGQVSYQDGLGFDGWMSGLQENPVATTSGSGLAVATVSNDLTSVDVWMVSDGLSGTVGAAHFHNGSLGNNGGVVLDLSGAVDDNDIQFSGPISDEVVSALLSGAIYINAHTPAFPGGEIRGQMYRLARDGYTFDLCPDQEVGVVNATSATGSGLLSVDRLHSNINILVGTDGLTDELTQSHFHQAPLGTNGPVIFDLTAFYIDGFLSGYGIPADTSFVSSVENGDIYVNVHTAANGGGEIRGQVVKELLCELPTSVGELEVLLDVVTLSPVPVIETLDVAIETHTNTDLSMRILDMSGKLLSTDQFQLFAGKNNVAIETGFLSPGFYILMISNGNAAQAYKFVK